MVTVQALKPQDYQDARSMQERSVADPDKLYPTLTCFDDAMELAAIYINNAGGEGTKTRDLFIVHGLMTLDGQTMAHAWIEHDGQVTDAKFYRGERVAASYEKQEFYETMSVREAHRYSPASARRETIKRGHVGPWDKALRRHMFNRGAPAHKIF